MWQIYGALGHGIALRSSIGQYRRAARFNVLESHYAFGCVKYHDDLASCPDAMLDLRQGEVPLSSGLWAKILDVAFLKRACFDYEREWRSALYQDYRSEEIAGCNIDFDLDELISAVYVGPRAEPFEVATVKAIMDRFQLRKPLNCSVLLSPPSKRMASPSAV